MRTAILTVALVLGLSPLVSASEQKVAVAPATACVCTCGQAVQASREETRDSFLKALREGKLTEPGLISEDAGQKVRR
jgi:hypothetical protein